MKQKFVLNAQARNDQGKSASRRLRRAGMVPGIMYGTNYQPTSLSFNHNELILQTANEAFFSHILTIKLDKSEESAIIKDMQRHPCKPIIMHIDLQRVSADEIIRVHVPLHFINAETSPGVKEGGLVTHNLIEVEVSCLPGDLPEFIEVDLANVALHGIVHLTDLKLPANVALVELLHGAGHNQPVASIHLPRAAKEEETTAAPAADATAAAGTTPPATPAA